jgi:diketogulonate reductase-like aldo/keto reductase
LTCTRGAKPFALALALAAAAAATMDEGAHPGSADLCEGMGRGVVELSNGRLQPVIGFGTADIGCSLAPFVPTEEYEAVLAHHIEPTAEVEFAESMTGERRCRWLPRQEHEQQSVVDGRRRAAELGTLAAMRLAQQAQHPYVEAVIKGALQVGYRFFDCAEIHGNEAAVGRAWRSSGLPREELFLQSKVWTSTIARGREAIRAAVEQTIADLGCEYLDCLLLHWPVPRKFVAAWQVLEELAGEGKVRSLGLSNFTVEDYLQLKPHIAPEHCPVVNQIEVNPLLFRRETIDFFKGEGLAVQAYSPLCGGRQHKGMRLQDPEGWMLKLSPALSSAAIEYGRSVAQVMGRWVLEHGCILIAKAERWEHAVDNAALFDFDITDEDMVLLDGLTGHDALGHFRDAYRAGCVQGCANLDEEHRVSQYEARNDDEFTAE